MTTDARAAGTFRLGGEREIARLGYGAMQITGEGVWGEPADRDGALAVLRRLPELGIDFVDTADSYGPFVSEDLIREALWREGSGYGELLVATKAGLVRTGPGSWHAVGRPEYLRMCCEMSLRRLGLEAIELYQLHRIDAKVDRDEQFGVLRELRDEGKIRHVGLSEVSVPEIEAAREIVPIATVQNHYNLATRQHEDVLDYCEREQIGFIPWFPLQSGALARPGGAAERVASELGVDPGQVALAWLLARSPVMLPIPGTSSTEHLEQNVAAAGLELSREQFAALDAASADG